MLACEKAGRSGCGCSSTTRTGSTSALCERVTTQLRDLLADYALEVRSPGPERPLTKPDHFRRFLGRRARVSAARAARRPPQLHRRARRRLGRRGDRGRRNGVVSIPYSEIKRSHLVEGAGAASDRPTPGGGDDDKEIVEAVGVLERGEGHLRGHADGGARGRAPVGLQEDAGRGQVRARRGRPRQRRLPRVRADPAARTRGAAARRGRGGGRRARRVDPETGEMATPSRRRSIRSG